MATVTHRFADFESGQCFWEYDYSNTSLKLLAWRCSNMLPYGSHAEVKSQSTGVTILKDVAAFNPQLDTTPKGFDENIPVNVQNQFDIGVDERGRLTGVVVRVWMG